MFQGRRPRVLQGFFRADGASRTPTRGPVAATAAFARPGIVQRAPRPDLLPGMMRPAPLGGGPRALSPIQRAAARPQPGAGGIRGAVGADVRGAGHTDVRATRLPPGHLPVIGRGQPLPDAVRRSMEAVFDADLSAVRVHHGSAARNLGALAFTLGDDVHFAPGQYDPHTRRGLELLGHELAHVVQQRAGRVVNPFGHGVAVVQDPRLEREADDMARRVGARMWQWRADTAAQPSARRAAAQPSARRAAAQPSMEESASIDIVLISPPPKKTKVTVKLEVTEKIRLAASKKDKDPIIHALAETLAANSPGMLPTASKLNALAMELIRVVPRGKLTPLTVRLSTGTKTTLTEEQKLTGSVYTRKLGKKKSAKEEMEEQYESMLEEATPERQPRLGRHVATIREIGKTGAGEARVAIYSQSKRGKSRLILYAHGYERGGEELVSTQRDRAVVFLVSTRITLTRSDESTGKLHAALPHLAHALAYPDVRATFVYPDYKLPAFRLAYHRPDELVGELDGLVPVMKYFDVGVLAFTRPNPIDNLDMMPPFGTSVPLNLVLDSPALLQYRDVVLHICRTPIVDGTSGELTTRRSGEASFKGVFYSASDKWIDVRPFEAQMEATEHLAHLPGWEDRAAKAFRGELMDYIDRKKEIERQIDSKETPSYIV